MHAPEVPGLDRFGRFVNRRELDALQPVLEPGEKVLYALEAAGRKAGLLAATDRRILFLWKAFFGHKLTSWPYPQVVAVRVGLDVDFATITLSLKDEEVVFARAKKRLAEAFAEAVKGRPPVPGALLDFTPRPVPRTPQQERLDRIERMFARGTMTKSEYERSRQALLQEA